MLSLSVLAPPIITSLTDAERLDLKHAKSLLESTSLSIRLANKVGAPLEKGMQLLPEGGKRFIDAAAEKALLGALKISIASLGKKTASKPHHRTHKLMAATSGVLGGLFGFATLPLELSASTAIILRSIAETAQSQGHDLSQIKTRLECLEVFALGGNPNSNDPANTSYWLTRAALAKSINETAAYLTQKSAVDLTAPVITRLINSIASRFGLLLSEEMAAKIVPIVGAAAGGAINVIFLDHFQQMAEGHFIIKRLEDRHGVETVRRLYEQLPLEKAKAR